MLVRSCGSSDIVAVDDIVANDTTAVSGSSCSLYARIDRLLDSNDNDKCTAFNELISQEILVCLF